jgi:hypothetical protein
MAMDLHLFGVGQESGKSIFGYFLLSSSESSRKWEKYFRVLSLVYQ